MITHYTKTSFLNHPFRLASFMFGRKEPLHETVLLRSGRILLGSRFSNDLAETALREIRTGDFLPMRESGGRLISGNKPGHLFGKFIYFFVRCLQPAVMVETGVAHGVSSWTILNAMEKNGKGKLYS